MPHSIVRAENEWRFDPVDGAWTVLALNRRTVPPFVVTRESSEASLYEASACPFCTQGAAHDERSGDAFGARVLDRVERGAQCVVALPSPTPLCFVEHEPPPVAPFVAGGALGAHEVLVPLGELNHGATLATLGEGALSGLFTLLARRSLDLREDRRLQSLSLSLLPRPLGRLDHLHASLLATPFPGREAKDPSLCPLCQDLKAAHAAGRVLIEGDGYTAYIPYAPRRTLHVRIAASAHGGIATFAALERLETAAAANDLARVVDQVANALAELAPSAPLILSLLALPISEDHPGAHVLFELTCPFEVDTPLSLGLGVRVVPFLPEELASILRPLVDA